MELVQKDTAVAGFAFADGIPAAGDGRWVPVRWKGKDLPDLHGQRVQLHFRLTKAKVFGYRIEGSAEAPARR